MKRFLFFSMALALIAFSSCKDDDNDGGNGGNNGGGCIESSGSTEIQSRTIGDFSEVQLNADFNLELIPGSDGTVSVHAPADLQEHILTTVSNGKLSISTVANACLTSPTPVRVIAKTPNSLSSVVLNSAGNIIADGPFTLPSALSVSNSGSGYIDMTGGCTTLNLDMDEDGEIRMFDFLGGVVTVSQRGSGKIECQVLPLGSLDINVSGSGSVYYKGNPLIYNENVTGSGTIVDAN